MLRRSDDTPATTPVPAPPARTLLRELGARWAFADTIEYRSQAVLQHQGEGRVTVRTWARLRRPGRARLVFSGSQSEASRVRVCDGTLLYDRMRGARQPTTRAHFSGALTQYIAHPLDTASYLVEQFFSRTPFSPAADWGGDSTDENTPVRFQASRVSAGPGGSGGAARDAFQITLSRGPQTRDTLTLDARTFAPIEIVRFGVHGGLAQELLRETITHIRLNVPLPDALFVWTPQDEAGAFPSL